MVCRWFAEVWKDSRQGGVCGMIYIRFHADSNKGSGPHRGDGRKHSSWISFRAHIWLIKGCRVEKNCLESQISTKVIKWSEFTQYVLLGEYRSPAEHGSVHFTPLSLALGIITKNKQASWQFALKGALFSVFRFYVFCEKLNLKFLNFKLPIHVIKLFIAANHNVAINLANWFFLKMMKKIN